MHFILNIFSVLLFASSSNGDATNYIKIWKVACELSPNFLVNTTCKLKAVSRYNSTITIGGNVIVPVWNATGNTEIFKKNAVNYKPFLINSTTNLCMFLDNRVSNFYARFIMGWLKKFSDINHPCPYSGPVYIRDLVLSPEAVPYFIPVGDYLIQSTLYESTPDKLIAKVKIYIDIGRKRPNIKQV